MANKIKDELLEMKKELGFYKNVKCTDEENKEYLQMKKDKSPLPEDVYYFNSASESMEYFYRILKIKEVSDEEFKEYIMLRQAKNIKTIKNCAVFFTVVAVIGIISAIILFAVTSGALT